MPDSSEILNAATIIPPYNGWTFGLYTSGTAVSLDLSTIGAQQPLADPAASSLDDILAPVQSNQPQFQGMLGKYVDFTAVSATCWVVFGPTQASVTSGNAPVIPTGTANLTGAGVPYPIFAGVNGKPWRISVSTRWIGLIGAGATFLMITPSSRGDRG